MIRLRKGFGKHKKPISIFIKEGRSYAKISLGKRKTTLISLSDIELLKEHSLYAQKRKDGQFVARSSQTGSYLHRLIMNPTEYQEVDHINHEPLDNTRGNLRPCSPRQNCLAKRQELIEGFIGIKCIKKTKLVKLAKNHCGYRGKYRVKYPDGTLSAEKYNHASEAAEARDDFMEQEYFHRASEEETFHPHAFITWNGSSPITSANIIEMEDWIFDEIAESEPNAAVIRENHGWELTIY